MGPGCMGQVSLWGRAVWGRSLYGAGLYGSGRYVSVRRTRVSVRPLQALLDLGGSPNYKDRRGLTPLYHTAMVGGDPRCCELLLAHRARIGTEDENGWQEIHQVRTAAPHRGPEDSLQPPRPRQDIGSHCNHRAPDRP